MTPVQEESILQQRYPDLEPGVTGIPGEFFSDIQKELIRNFSDKDIADALDYFAPKNNWFETETFVVLGDNVPQTRPRSAALPDKGMVVYDEAPVRIWKNNIRLSVQSVLPDDFVPALGDCHLYISVFKRIPKSFSQRKRILAELGLLRPEKSPDLDNYVKSIEDALKSVLWMDDCQVTFTESKKLYSMKPRLEFMMRFRAERLDK